MFTIFSRDFGFSDAFELTRKFVLIFNIFEISLFIEEPFAQSAFLLILDELFRF